MSTGYPVKFISGSFQSSSTTSHTEQVTPFHNPPNQPDQLAATQATAASAATATTSFGGSSNEDFQPLKDLSEASSSTVYPASSTESNNNKPGGRQQPKPTATRRRPVSADSSLSLTSRSFYDGASPDTSLDIAAGDNDEIEEYSMNASSYFRYTTVGP